MTALIITALCVLAVTKATLQSYFVKKEQQSFSAKILFNFFIFVAASLLFIPGMAGKAFHLPVFLYGILTGLLCVTFQSSYINAFSLGDVSLTILINNCGMVIPILFCAIAYREPLGPIRIIGILLTGLSFYFSLKVEKGKKLSKKWLLFVLVAFVANALIMVVQKLFTKSDVGSFQVEYVGYTYISAAVLAILLYFAVRKKGEKGIRKKSALSALLVGVVLGSFFMLNTYAVSTIDGTLLLPVYNAGATLLSTVVSVLLYKERMSTKRLIGFALGILSIVLMSL